LRFQEYCAKSKGKVNCHLVTQNIDDYDAQLIKSSKILTPEPFAKREGTEDFAFTSYVIEMHGNVKYMHCSDEEKDCSRVFYLAPKLDQISDRTNCVPRCTVCEAPMKPHAMFFDECYNERYYRFNTTTDIEYDLMDCLIVIGTALATSGARAIVHKTLTTRQHIPVIEVNMEPQCKVGWALNVTEKSETALPKMFDKFYNLAESAKKSNTQLKPKIGQSSGKSSLSLSRTIGGKISPNNSKLPSKK